MERYAVFDVLRTWPAKDVLCVIDAVSKHRHIGRIDGDAKHAVVVVATRREQQVPSKRKLSIGGAHGTPRLDRERLQRPTRQSGRIPSR